MHALFLCGRSCWAFSTVGAVEGLNKIVSGELVTLSEQDLINCNKENNGCRGGKVEAAYEFIVNNGGLGTDNDYPYKAVNEVCNGPLKENNTNVVIDGYENLPANDELALRKAVAHQPITAIIDFSFMNRGGKVETAYEFIVNNGGLGTDNDYPYKAVNGVCHGRLKENNKNVMIDGFENLPSNDEYALMKAVAHQPVTAILDSSSREFQLYESGIFDGPCGTNLNHGVVVVGYGTENGRDYWIVRNSRGNTWGEAGYMKMARNIANPRGLCGIAMRASYPLKNSFTRDISSIA
ncbi:unnamed protein product [Thlaspi arvense]|uniref:Peptidase C1A papain C-terminal domain-containing protein n=1 Tax=Thlaspi arvense TaxID=13288 RepID=A0AAU9SQY6_THLAR|nr:unnamed protein product [Thlaspi arvense]